MLNLVNMIPLPWKILGAAVLVLSLSAALYFSGYNNARVHYENVCTIEKNEIKSKYEKQINDFRTQSAAQIDRLTRREAEVKEVVVTQFVDRVNTIRDNNTIYRDAIVEVPTRNENLSVGWIDVHDSVVRGQQPTSPGDTSDSGVSDTQALLRVSSNYSRCKETEAQLNSLQEWVRQMEAEATAANKE